MVNKKFGILAIAVIAQNLTASQSHSSVPVLSTKAISTKAQETWAKSELNSSQKAAVMYMYLRDLEEHHGREALTKVMNPDEGIRIPLQEAIFSLDSIELFNVYLQFHADPFKDYGERPISEKVLKRPAFAEAIKMYRQTSLCKPYITRLLAGEYPRIIAGELKNLIDTNVIFSDDLIDTLQFMAREKRNQADEIQNTVAECNHLILGLSSGSKGKSSNQDGWISKAFTEPRISVGQVVVTAGALGLAGLVGYKLIEKGLLPNLDSKLFAAN